MGIVNTSGQSSLSSIEIVHGQANLTDTSSTEVLAADTARFTYITDIVISAKAGATSIHKIDILEATTVLVTVYVALGTLVANTVINLTTPIKTSAVNKAINAKSGASPTAFDALVTVSGYQAKN